MQKSEQDANCLQCTEECPPSATQVLSVPTEVLRACGLSGAKVMPLRFCHFDNMLRQGSLLSRAANKRDSCVQCRPATFRTSPGTLRAESSVMRPSHVSVGCGCNSAA